MVPQVKAGFIDADDVVSIEATFILPAELPQERAGGYKTDSDPENLVYRVTNRVQCNPGCPQADFGHQAISFQHHPLDENDDNASSETESDISMDGNPSTIESNVAAEMSILDSYARAISSARSSADFFPLAIRQESLWLNALDIDEPTGSRTRRSSLEWLDLAAADDILSTTQELLGAVESYIEEPEDTTVLEPSLIDREYGAEKHPDVQRHTASQNEGRWGDNIDLDAAFGGSATDLEEDFPDSNEDDHLQYQANPKENRKWGDNIDLDEAFGGSATDLEEEFEDLNSQPTAVYVSNAPLMEGDSGFESPNLRQHIPEDIEERVNQICRTRFLDGNEHVVAGGWALAEACARWEYMSEAAKENKRLGLFKRQGKIPQEVSRSCATSFDNEEWPIDKPPARPVNETVPEPCHHINFQWNPCPTRSNTPPEVSLWAVVTSNSRRHHETFSRQGVIIAQANKLIDPFEYDPAGFDLGQLTGSELKSAVVGKVRKVYLDCGTWLDDVYSAKDHVPAPLSYESMMSRVIYWKGTYWHHSLREPHRINNLLDLDDLVVNKGEIVPPKRHYREPSHVFLSSPSKLCVVELLRDEEPEARPMIPNIRSMESYSRAESNEEERKEQTAAADRAQDQSPGSPGQTGRDDQMETRSDTDLDEEETRTSSQIDEQNSRYKVEKANEDLQQIVLSAAALSTSPASSEIEESSSIFQSRGSPSSVSTSSEAELTALDEVKLDAELDVMLEQLSQLQVDQKEDDVQSFANSLPNSGQFDTLRERDDEKEHFFIEEHVCRFEKALSDLPQERAEREEGLLVNDNVPAPENGYPALTQDSPRTTEKLIVVGNAPQPEDTGLHRIWALEAILMREFDFSKKGIRSSTSAFGDEKANKFLSPVDIPYSDVSEIPLRQDDNDKLYGPVAIAVGRKALEVTDWVRSWMWGN